MGSHVALLRAINVGGRNRVAMADLRELFVYLRLEPVQTFLQSGNVVFESPTRAGKPLERSLAAQCAVRLGVETEFFVRSARQWNAVVEQNPFAEEARETPGKLVVVFLKKTVSGSAIRTLQSAIKGKEYVSGVRSHVYVMYPDGIGRSRLTAAAIERVLGTPGTARNWNTILKLQAGVSKTSNASSHEGTVIW